MNTIASTPSPSATTQLRHPRIRYAQCWEDADILLCALAIRPDDVCLSIASAGGNTLALLTANPAKVIAIDTNPSQLACLELCVCAFRRLSHAELLFLVGSRPGVPGAPGTSRLDLYRRLRTDLSHDSQTFFDAHQSALAKGLGSMGRFEHYFQAFRRWFLPLVHDRRTVAALLKERSPAQRRRFYDRHWNSPRWRALFSFFFSKQTMGLLGRDRRCFSYVEGDIHDRIFAATEHALTELDPSANPYLHWILTGTHGQALPVWLQPEHFETIKGNLDRLEWHQASLSQYLSSHQVPAISKFNLSDVFEYMSAEEYQRQLEQIVAASSDGARLAYWNMAVPRRRPACMSDTIAAHRIASRSLHRQDRAFFYRDFVIEEVTK